MGLLLHLVEHNAFIPAPAPAPIDEWNGAVYPSRSWCIVKGLLPSPNSKPYGIRGEMMPQKQCKIQLHIDLSLNTKLLGPVYQEAFNIVKNEIHPSLNWKPLFVILQPNNCLP
ncbi:hypothetical protein V6N13_102691 [Hibiscus sabdariffa]